MSETKDDPSVRLAARLAETEREMARRDFALDDDEHSIPIPVGDIRGVLAEVDRLRAELAAHHAREEWFESRDVEVRRADEDDGPDDDIEDGDEADDQPVFRKWGVVVWHAGRGLTYYGDTLADAIDAARVAEKGGTR